MGAVRYTDIEETDQVSIVGEGLFELNQNLGLSIGFEAGHRVRHLAGPLTAASFG